MLNLKALLTKLTTTLNAAVTVTTPTASITTTTGTISEICCKKYGPVVQLCFRVKNSSQVGVGKNIYVGTLTTTNLRPLCTATGCNFYGLRPIVTSLDSSGNITVVNAANQNLSANSETRSNLIYIVSEI